MNQIELTPQMAFEEGILSDVGLFLAKEGIVKILQHGSTTPEVWINRNRISGKFLIRFNDGMQSAHDRIAHGIVPSNCLNSKDIMIAFGDNTKNKVRNFIKQLGLTQDEADYIVEWNCTNSILNRTRQENTLE